MKQIDKALLKPSEMEGLADLVLREAKRLGADQAEVGIAANHGFNVSAHDGDVETVEYNQDKSIDISVMFGKRSGAASLSDIRPEAVHAAVEAACHIAKFTSEDLAAGLAEKDELAFNYPQLDLAFPWDISVEKAIELACQCEREAKAYDKRIISADDVAVTTANAMHFYANSFGFVGYFPFTRHEMSCVLVGKDKEGMQRDYSYTLSADPKKLASISAIAKEAAERTIKRLGARRLPTMKAPVIFFAEEARGLLGHFVSAIQGSNIYRKSSFLVDHIGKKIFPDFVHLQEHPHLLDGIGSAPFDDDGVLTRDNVFVENGVLQQYALGVYSARKLGVKTTGNSGGIHNLTIRPGNKDLSELLRTMNKGLLVTELMGQGVNILTGDYSRGVGGYWVENGEIQFPVHEVTIAGNLQDMYSKIVEVGNDVDIRGNIRTGSILISEMMIAGE